MPSSIDFKAMAVRLADHLSATHGVKLRHTSALAAVAAMHGAKDWHTLLARQGESADKRLAALAPDGEPRGNASEALEEDAEKVILQAIVECISKLASPRSQGVQKAWLYADQVYAQSLALRDALRSELPPLLVESIGYRTRVGGADPLDTVVLDILSRKGWLVAEPQGHQHLGRSTQWDVRVGGRVCVGAVVLRLPQAVHAQLPMARMTRDPVVVTISRATATA